MLTQKRGSVDSNITRIAFECELSPLGPTSFEVAKSDWATTRYFPRMATSLTSADNGVIGLEITPDGAINITDHRTGEVYRDLMTYYDDADAGDGWYHVTPVGSSRIVSVGAPVQTEIVNDGPAACTFRVTKTLTLPRELLRGDGRMTEFHRSPEKVEMKIVSDVTLGAGEDRVHVKTSVYNNAMDHRLRVRFPSGTSPEGDYIAEVPFCFVTRRPGADYETEHWMEADRGDKPTSGAVIRREGSRGIAVGSHYGVHECVAATDRDASIDLTLFRAFRQTVITDFAPDAEGQVQGRQDYEFTIMPLTADTTLTDIKRALDSDVAGTRCCAKHGAPKKVAPYLELSGGGAYSTMKPTEEGDGVVVRITGLDESTRTTLKFVKEIKYAALCDLKEDEVEELTADGGKVSFDVAPWKIVTVKVRF